MNICVGIATLKDDVYFIDPIKEDEEFYYIEKKTGNYKIEKELTKPLVKISDMKEMCDVRKISVELYFHINQKEGKRLQ